MGDHAFPGCHGIWTSGMAKLSCLQAESQALKKAAGNRVLGFKPSLHLCLPSVSGKLTHHSIPQFYQLYNGDSKILPSWEH